MPRNGPSLRRSALDPGLARELRRIRIRTGMTADRAAELVGWSLSKMSRIETGRSGVTIPDLRAILRLYRVGEDRIAELVAFAQERASVVSRFEAASDPLHGAGEACGVLEYATMLVPRLLRTTAYTLAVHRSAQRITRATETDIEDLADAIAAWRGAHPAVFRTVMAEAVLYQNAESAEVMIGQLGVLADPPPWAQMRVLPQASAGPLLPCGFMHLTYPRVHEVASPDRVLIDEPHQVVALTEEHDTTWYRFTFDALWGAAEEPGPVIKRALKVWA